MHSAKVICNGISLMFFCHSPESPDYIWKPLIERTVYKWKLLTKDDKFYSAYMQGNLVFLLFTKDKQIQVHHWLKEDEAKIPPDVKKVADDLQSETIIDRGMFTAEVKPWKDAN